MQKEQLKIKYQDAVLFEEANKYLVKTNKISTEEQIQRAYYYGLKTMRNRILKELD
jgi:hypothetical protein